MVFDKSQAAIRKIKSEVLSYGGKIQGARSLDFNNKYDLFATSPYDLQLPEVTPETVGYTIQINTIDLQANVNLVAVANDNVTGYGTLAVTGAIYDIEAVSENQWNVTRRNTKDVQEGVDSLFFDYKAISGLLTDYDPHAVTDLSTGLIDSSGNSHHATIPAGNTAPALISNELNGYNVARFNNTDTALLLPAAVHHIPSGDNTAILVLKGNSINAQDRVLSLSSNTGTKYEIRFETSPNQGEFGSGAFTGLEFSVNELDWNIIVCRRQGVNLEVSVNGSAFITGTGGADISDVTGAMIGRAAANSQDYFDGDIARIMMYDAYVVQDDVDKMVGLLAHRYALQGSLPITHPYKTQSPNKIDNIGAATAPTHTPQNYTAGGDSIDDHLQGIDAAINKAAIFTTNNMTLEAGKSYMMGAGHTLNLPAGNAGDIITIAPATGTWASVGGEIDSNDAAGDTLMDGQPPITSSSDALTLIFDADNSNWVGFTGGVSGTSSTVLDGAILADGGWKDTPLTDGSIERRQWGLADVASDDAVIINLHVPFADVDYTIMNAVKGGLTSAGAITHFKFDNFTTTTFTIDRDNDYSGTTSIMWEAIGKKP